MSLRPEAAARLQLDVLTAELADELRVEYASLLAWAVGLVIGMLTEIEAAGAKAARRGSRPLITSQ